MNLTPQIADLLALADFAVLSEDDFQAWFTWYAAAAGWRHFHPRPAVERSGQWATAYDGDDGFPDSTCARDGHVLFAELKSRSGKMSPGQKVWRELLMAAERACVSEPTCVSYRLWKPSDRVEIRAFLA